MKTVCLAFLPLALFIAGCSTDSHKDRYVEATNTGNVGVAGGFWEGLLEYPSDPPFYYGLTFVESRGQLLGTCFQGGKDGISLYYLENCKIKGNHFEGRWIYPPANLGEMIEGTFDGDCCHFTNYVTEGYGVIELHRVQKLSKTPNIFQRLKNGEMPDPRSKSIAGGYWEGSGLYKPSCYYGFTFVESRGHLLGTCYQGDGGSICLYYLDNCVIGDKHFDGRKIYPSANLSDKIEGDIDGDSCRLVDYGAKDYDVINLHRVKTLSKIPTVFRDPPEKKQ